MRKVGLELRTAKKTSKKGGFSAVSREGTP